MGALCCPGEEEEEEEHVGQKRRNNNNNTGGRTLGTAGRQPQEVSAGSFERQHSIGGGRTLRGTGRMASQNDNDEQDDVRARMRAAAEARQAKNAGVGTQGVNYHDSRRNPHQPPRTNTTASQPPQQQQHQQRNSDVGGKNHGSGMVGSNSQEYGSSVAMAGRQVSTGEDPAENPMLQAALRRQQAAGGGGSAGQQQLGESPEEKEKARLLREIRSELRKQHKDEPFGLPSSDCTKLRTYLQHLKSGK